LRQGVVNEEGSYHRDYCRDNGEYQASLHHAQDKMPKIATYTPHKNASDQLLQAATHHPALAMPLPEAELNLTSF
jgi:hypothetical protein